MFTVYTISSSQSCRKTIEFLNKGGFDYREVRMKSTPPTYSEFLRMLQLCENDIFDIISEKSKVYKESNLDFNDMKLSEIYEFAKENPSAFKAPIVMADSLLLVGYKKDEIQRLLPRKVKKGIFNKYLEQARANEVYENMAEFNQSSFA